MEKSVVHPRVHERHPEISDDDALSAWNNAFEFAKRDTSEKDLYVAVGFDTKGRLIEVVAAREDDGRFLIFHAMTPPSKKTLGELRLMG